MNTVALIDHILLVLGNLGGIFEFANTRVFPFVEENALVLFLVCWITLILVLIYKGAWPCRNVKRKPPLFHVKQWRFFDIDFRYLPLYNTSNYR